MVNGCNQIFGKGGCHFTIWIGTISSLMDRFRYVFVRVCLENVGKKLCLFKFVAARITFREKLERVITSAEIC